MIMEQDQRRGARARRRAEDFARMDDAGVDRADGDDRRPQHAVLRVEQQDAELLDRAGAVLRDEHLRGVDRRANLKTFAPGAHERAAAGFDGGDQLGGAGTADAGHPAELVGRGARETVEAADGRQHGIGEIERARPRDPVAQDEREQLVIAEHTRPRPLELFTRPIVRREDLHRGADPLACLSRFVRGILLRVRRLPTLVLVALIASGCSQPPQKEIDQAQTALDAAKAAGAEKYATDEYNAAAGSLQKSHDAVDQRDYRQALNYAIDSRQRSQEAAKLAAEGKVRARQAASQLVTDVGTRYSQARMHLQAIDPSGTSKDLRLPRGMLMEAESSLQDARTAIRSGNYDKVTELLTYVRGIVDQADKLLDNVPQKPAKKKTS